MNREQYYHEHYLARVNRRLAPLRENAYAARLARRKARAEHRFALWQGRKNAPAIWEAGMQMLLNIHQEIAPAIAQLRIAQYATEEYLAHE